ncbi:hypothetical protein [Anabaena sp. CCY 9910]|uniref:hypothetical protein n=1 Tax=Anabaena sp. CCY 9910 TaxID=3103870 RepID=UPI0039E11CE7
MLYSHLYSWRNLCEYLNSRPYKFAYPYQIKRDCKCLPSLYAKDRLHRQVLFDNYLIQFIHWCPHPDDSYGGYGRRRRKYDSDWGWQLCREWEAKIDFLEQIVLFGREPATKSWEPALKIRMQIRAERQAKLELDKKLSLLKIGDRKTEAAKLNICWQCLGKIAFMMVDCVSCGAIN